MARGSTLNVSLTKSLDKYVRAKVASGGYESTSEVIRESLRLSQAFEQSQQLFWAGAREKVKVARKQITQGKVVDGEAEMERIIAELEEKTPAKPKQRKR